MKDCKYYNEHINTVRAYIDCLYQITGVYNGGLLHVMIDDKNVDDSIVRWTLERCKVEKEEESEIGKLICEEFLKLSMEQRRLVIEEEDNITCYTVICCPNCEECPIYNQNAKFWRE